MLQGILNLSRPKYKKYNEVLILYLRDYICKKMAVEFIYNTNYSIQDEKRYSSWVKAVINSEKFVLGEVVFAFFDDEEMKKINLKFLKKDYYTDVICFNDSKDSQINGNIAISVDRVKDNALTYKSEFLNEMLRVMAHGLLHCMNYSDNNENEKMIMANKETEKIKMFHVEP
tara:strand:- start:657 stop:1172 length:516 start_codon:yes stop_codon:yes gene_type:complete